MTYGAELGSVGQASLYHAQSEAKMHTHWPSPIAGHLDEPDE